MTINIMYDKEFAKKSLIILAVLASIIGAYKLGFKRGMTAMAKYFISLQEAPRGNSDGETGNVGHFGN